MLEQAITEWREAALAEGRSQAIARARARLCRQAARRFGSEAGYAFAALLDNEEDSQRLDTMSDLVVVCASGDELLRRGRSVLLQRNGP